MTKETIDLSAMKAEQKAKSRDRATEHLLKMAPEQLVLLKMQQKTREVYPDNVEYELTRIALEKRRNEQLPTPTYDDLNAAVEAAFAALLHANQIAVRMEVGKVAFDHDNPLHRDSPEGVAITTAEALVAMRWREEPPEHKREFNCHRPGIDDDAPLHPDWLPGGCYYEGDVVERELGMDKVPFDQVSEELRDRRFNKIVERVRLPEEKDWSELEREYGVEV